MLTRHIILIICITSKLYSQEKFSVDPYFNPNLTKQERDSILNNISYYSKLIESDSTNISAFFERGCLWIKLGMHHKAYHDFSSVIKLDSTQAIAYYNRALSRAKFSYNLDACLDLYKAKLLGLKEAETLYLQKCGYYKNRIEKP